MNAFGLTFFAGRREEQLKLAIISVFVRRIKVITF